MKSQISRNVLILIFAIYNEQAIFIILFISCDILETFNFLSFWLMDYFKN